MRGHAFVAFAGSFAAQAVLVAVLPALVAAGWGPAQPKGPVAPEGPAPPQPQIEIPANSEDADPDAPIVFVLPQDVDPGVADTALRTIRAHTQDVGAALIIERPPSMPPGNREQMRRAAALAEEHGARGVFWLDLSVDDDILLYLHEPTGLHTLLRRLPRVEGSDAATLESLGVVVHSIGSALVAGGQIGMTVVEPEEPEEPPEVEKVPAPAEPAKPPPPPREPPPGRTWPLLRLAAGYAGNSFGDQLEWQHAVEFAASVRPLRRMYLGVTYAVVLPSTVEHELVAIELRRHPISLVGGFRGDPVRALGLEAEIAGTLDLLERRSTTKLVAATDPATVVVFGVGPRGRIAYIPAAGLELRVEAGLDVIINNVNYVVASSDQKIDVLRAHIVRARVGGGVAYAFF